MHVSVCIKVGTCFFVSRLDIFFLYDPCTIIRQQQIIKLAAIFKINTLAQVSVFRHMLAATKIKRTALLIIILNVLALSVRSQSVIKVLKKNTSSKHTQELILEISKVFELIQKNFNVDLNNEDTLYLIRGVDIQDRAAYGRLWNRKVLFHYTDSKEWNNGKILKPVPVVSVDKEKNVTQDFDRLIPDIENNKKEKVISFTKKRPVLSGIDWDIIIYIKREGKKPILSIYSVDDFALIK
jgi:hypothetical protein